MLSTILALVLFQATPAPSPSASAAPSATPAASPAASPTPSPAPLAVSPATVNLHPAQSGTVAIATGTAPYTVTFDVPLATATIDQTARVITLTAGKQTGHAIATVTDAAGATVQIPLWVGIDAGTVAPSLALTVTGTQLDPAWLTQQIARIVGNAATLQPGALLEPAVMTLPSVLGPGASAAIPVRVHIAGRTQYFDVDATTEISVQNLDVAPFDPPVLYYDDDPEKLVATGVSFAGIVDPGSPVRLYYYHENGQDPHKLAVVLSSASAQSSQVQLIDASAGPNIDVMSVGHAVTRDFLTRNPLDEGIVAGVSAQTPYIVDDFSMNRLDGAAGSIGIRVLAGPAVTVTVLSLPPDVPDAQVAAQLTLPRMPDDGHHRTGAFSIAQYGTQTLAYTAGGPDASVQYGAQSPPPFDPPDDPVPAGHDYGEYGVWRTVTFDIDNPFEQPATLYLYERPLGGVVRSSFRVNGTVVQVGCARVSQPYQIGDPIVVPARASLQLPVDTMTDGGSNYPLELGITATPPQPSTPPISAANGCFPKS